MEKTSFQGLRDVFASGLNVIALTTCCLDGIKKIVSIKSIHCVLNPVKVPMK